MEIGKLLRFGPPLSIDLELNPESGQTVFVYLAAQEQGLHLALESGGENRVSGDAKSVTGSPPVIKSRQNASKPTGEAVRAVDSPRVPSEPPAGWPTRLHRRGSLRAVYPAKKIE